MYGFMKTVFKKSSGFSSRVAISKEYQSFFPPPFLSLLSLPFFIVRSDFKAFWRCEIKVHMAVLVQSLHTVFINSVIYTIGKKKCQSSLKSFI